MFFWQYIERRNLEKVKDEIIEISKLKFDDENDEIPLDFDLEEIKNELNLTHSEYRKALLDVEWIKDKPERFYINKSKIIELLEEEKNIIENYICSKDSDEKTEFYKDFIKSEKNLFDVYESDSNFAEKISKANLLSRSINSLEFTFLKFIDKLKNGYFLTILLVVSAIFFVFPYYAKINSDLNMAISYDNFVFINLTLYGFFVLILMFIYIFFQIFMLYNISKHNSKALNLFFIFPNLFLLTLILLPLFDYLAKEFLLINSLGFENTFLLILILYTLSFFIWCLSCKDVKYLSDKFLAFLLIVLFDILAIFFAYINFKEENFFGYIILLFLIFTSRILAFKYIFNYKFVLSVVTIFTLIFIVYLLC
ncbi:Uncharacterised protein [Campylobacter geochelonis]|nr:Uncharacterised protein [Campylobacter geochelonis]